VVPARSAKEINLSAIIESFGASDIFFTESSSELKHKVIEF